MSVYKNGNTIVEIRNDGTKIRFVPDGSPALPVYPESIDMKICNRCDVGCKMCHEQSTKDGKLGDLSSKLIESLHPYTEVAIGGGDPLSHPNLPELLLNLKKKNVITNITVHWRSFMKNLSLLHDWTDLGLIHGLGVSINEKVPDEIIDEFRKFPLAVAHIIIGVAAPSAYEQLMDKDLNILLLGYKDFGRGKEYYSEHATGVNNYTKWVKENLHDMLKRFRAVSFDNLAIDQVELKKMLDPEVYTQIYMGSDGTFTMYVDLVENKYAISSTSERHDIFSDNIDALFANVREMAKE